MADELKAAAERYRNSNGFACSDMADDGVIDCLATLADAYFADLAAREANERERALPIDREWLQLQGQDIGMDVLAGGLSLIVADSTWSKVFAWKSHVDPNRERFIKTCTTRGEVMDLIALFPSDTKDAA